MKTYFAKFVGLPFLYSTVKAATQPVAEEWFKKWRDDAIVCEASKFAVSFVDYEKQRYKKVNVEDHAQTVFAVGDLYNGKQHIVEINKYNHILSLKKQFEGVPRIASAQIFEPTKGMFHLVIKPSPDLIKYIIATNGDLSEEMVKEQVGRTSTFPLYIYKVRATKPLPATNQEENNMARMITAGGN